MAITTEDSQLLAERYARAWNDHDSDAIMALYTPDTRYQLHGRTEVLGGQEGVAESFASDLRSGPDIRFELVTMHCGANHAVFQSRITGTSAGKPISFEAADVLTFRDNLVLTKDTYLIGRDTFKVAESSLLMYRFGQCPGANRKEQS